MQDKNVSSNNSEEKAIHIWERIVGCESAEEEKKQRKRRVQTKGVAKTIFKECTEKKNIYVHEAGGVFTWKQQGRLIRKSSLIANGF